MNIAIVKNSICENVIVCEDVEIAQILFPNSVVTEIENGYGIGDIYKNGVWTKSESTPAEQPDIETDLMELSIDHEYRLTMLELGITEV